MSSSRKGRWFGLLLKPFHLTLLVLIVSLVYPKWVWSGAWPRKKNEIYLKADVYRFKSDEIFAAKGNKKIPGPDFCETGSNIYGEYGLTSVWTSIFSLNYKQLSTNVLGRTQETSGFGDLWLNVKRGLGEKVFVFSLQGGVKVPFGYRKLEIPALGDGQIDLEIRGQAGKSLYPFPGYLNAEIGYRKRNGDFSDEIPFLFEIGGNIGKRVWIKLLYDGVSSFSDDTASTTSNRHPNIFDEEYTTISPGLSVLLLNGISLELLYQRVLTGGNTAAGNKYFVGVSWKSY